MIESAVRAGRGPAPSVASDRFVWQVPGKAQHIEMMHAAIARMESEVVESFRSLTSRGSETGGLLLGRYLVGDPATVCIEDYESVACDYTRGPLYRLGEADLERFQARLAAPREDGLVVVGFFRSHTRKGLSLDAGDLELWDSLFADPHQVALLVRPFATKTSTAGFFFREPDGVHGDASYLEFPFQAGPAGKTEIAVSQGTAPEEAAAPERKPAGPRLVPIAARRPAPVAEQPEPVIAPAPPPEPVREPEAGPIPEPKPRPVPPLVVAESLPARTPEPVLRRPAAEAPARPLPEPPLFGSSAEADTPPRRSRLPIVAAAAAACAALGVGLFLYPGWLRSPHKSPAAVAAVQDTSPLALRLENTSTGLLLTWNRNSPVVQGATKAVLSITDGSRHEEFPMDLAQLRTGSVVYPPLSSDVSFSMQVSGKDEMRTTSESVRMLNLRPSPMPATDAKAAAQGPAAAETAEAAPAESKPVVATHKYDAGSLGGRLRPARSSEVPDAPALSAAAVPAISIPGVSSSVPSLPAAPQAAPAAPPVERAQAGLQPAEILQRREPAYPDLARRMKLAGSVKLKATIAPTGRVVDVKAISGNSVLAQAAVEAVRSWVYKPARLGGQPVQSEASITFNFGQTR